MAISAQENGLDLGTSVVRKLDRLTERNDYVRVRYMVVDTKGDIKPEAILVLANEVREAVRLALRFDEFGNPFAQVSIGAQS